MGRLIRLAIAAAMPLPAAALAAEAPRVAIADEH